MRFSTNQLAAFSTDLLARRTQSSSTTWLCPAAVLLISLPMAVQALLANIELEIEDPEEGTYSVVALILLWADSLPRVVFVILSINPIPESWLR